MNSKAPFGHWGTQTFVAGLKCDGLIAPWVIDAPMNRIIFEAYVETQLAPALKPGDVVILDNLSSHKSERVETAMCPDAHGADQKSLFKIIDISKMKMRIEGMGERKFMGYAATLGASRSAAIANKKDPITEVYEKLAGTTTTMTADANRQLAAICFATQPPPKEDIDGPFLFMPGYFVRADETIVEPMDSIVIPAQTYLVLSYSGTVDDIGNMRFTLTEEFFQKVAPYLGLQRAIGPNMMIWEKGLKGNEPTATLEMWTPIKPFSISPR